MNLSELLKDYEPLHSNFQLERLVLVRNGQTLYGCFKQVLRELAARIPVVLEACNRVICRIQQNDLAISESHQVYRLVEIYIVRDQMREFCILYNYAVALKYALGDLTPSRKSELECDYWIHHAKSAIARDFISEGRLTPATLELLHAFPNNMRSQVLQYVTNPLQHEAIIAWYLNYELQLPLPEIESWQGVSQFMSECCEMNETERLKLLSTLGIPLPGFEKT
jgi:hypothetical protein